MLSKSWGAAQASLPGAVALALAGMFVLAAATMGAKALALDAWPATAIGSGSILLASALLANITLALGPFLTLGRRRYAAAIVLGPIWLVCAALSFQSITKFCAEHLLDSETVREKAADDYNTASDLVRSKRQQRAEIDEVRSVSALDKEIAGLLAKPLRSGGTVGEMTRRRTTETWRASDSCAEVHKLETAMAVARKRDELDGEIAAAVAVRSKLQPVASGEASGRLIGMGSADGAETRGLIGMARRVTGIDVRSAEELRAISLALLIWLGEVLMPIVASLAIGRNVPPRADRGGCGGTNRSTASRAGRRRDEACCLLDAGPRRG